MRSIAPHQALLAIKARLNGEFDSPYLVSFGALSVDPVGDVLYIVNTTLEEIEQSNAEYARLRAKTDH